MIVDHTAVPAGGQQLPASPTRNNPLCSQRNVLLPLSFRTAPFLYSICVPGLRSDTSIVVETAQAFSTHHAAMLIGYGAHALCPYLAYETARQWRLSSRTQSLVKSGKVRCGV